MDIIDLVTHEPQTAEEIYNKAYSFSGMKWTKEETRQILLDYVRAKEIKSDYQLPTRYYRD